MSFRINLALLSIAATLLTVPAANAAKCTDIPLRVTLHETAVLMNLDGTAAGGTVASAIVGDGNDVYTNGQTTGATINPALVNGQGLNTPFGMVLDGENHLFVANYFGNTIGEYDATPMP